MPDSIYYGTSGDDTVDGSKLDGEYANIDLLEGDDTVYLSSFQTFISNYGDDTVIGDGTSGYALWYANEPVYVNLEEGYAYDGYGGVDTLSGIYSVHMTSKGGTVIGSSKSDMVFCFGGESYIDLGDSNDTVRMYDIDSSDYEVECIDGVWFLRGDEHVLEIHNTEIIEFEDKRYTTDFISYTKNEPYIYDAKTATGLLWYERVDINSDGLMDIIYYANSTRSWSSSSEITPEAYLQVLIQQPDGSWSNQTDSIITNQLSPILGLDLTLGDFNGDGVLDFMLGGYGWDPYEDGEPATDVEVEYGEPDIFYISQSDGTWRCETPIDSSAWTHNVSVGDINLDGLDDAFSSSIFSGYQDLDPSRSLFSIGDEYGNLYAEQLSLPSWLSGISRDEIYIRDDGEEAYSEDRFTGSLLFDANGDNAVDLLVLPLHSSKTSLLMLNDGSGDFSNSEIIELPPGPYGEGGISIDHSTTSGSIMLEAVGFDIDRDGDNDVVTLSTNGDYVDGDFTDYYNGASIQVLLNDGTGHFSVAQTIELVPESAGNYSHYSRIEVCDINRDGWADIITQSRGQEDTYQTRVFINENGVLNEATEEIIPNRVNNFIPLHIDGELGLVEFYDTWYGTDPEDGAGLATTTFTLLENPDFEVGHTIAGSTDAENLIGSPQNDTFIWSWGSDVFNGLDGVDKLVVPGNLLDIDISEDKTSLTYGYETVYMTSIERVEAKDNSLAFDIDGNAGKAYRIYQAAFDRTPDFEGLGYWIEQMDNGMSLEDVANSFIDSSEFKTLYGENPTDEEFVTLLYNNVLHRDPDSAGMDYWINEFNTGIIDKVGALASFSESAENIANVEDIIADGIEYIEYDLV